MYISIVVEMSSDVRDGNMPVRPHKIGVSATLMRVR
jgi:hypothetical protein